MTRKNRSCTTLIFLLWSLPLLLLLLSCAVPKTGSSRSEFFYLEHTRDRRTSYDVLKVLTYADRTAEIFAAHGLDSLAEELINGSLYQLLEGGNIVNSNGDINFPYSDGTGYDYFYRLPTGSIVHYDLTGHPVAEWYPFKLANSPFP